MLRSLILNVVVLCNLLIVILQHSALQEDFFQLRDAQKPGWDQQWKIDVLVYWVY